MRSIDGNLARAINKHWQGQEQSNTDLCSLLANLDQFLAYLDEHVKTPGNVIDPCPECGQEHRWALLSQLLIYALDFRSANQSRMLEMKDKSLESVRALYGGEKGYQEVREKAGEFFQKRVTRF
jgi:hypothetical protein